MDSYSKTIEENRRLASANDAKLNLPGKAP